MAEAAIAKVRDADVEALAKRIARNQRIEIGEYAAAAKRIGVAVPNLGADGRAASDHGGHP